MQLFGAKFLLRIHSDSVFETNLIIAYEGFILIIHSCVENVLCKFIDLVNLAKSKI